MKMIWNTRKIRFMHIFLQITRKFLDNIMIPVLVWLQERHSVKQIQNFLKRLRGSFLYEFGLIEIRMNQGFLQFMFCHLTI